MTRSKFEFINWELTALWLAGGLFRWVVLFPARLAVLMVCTTESQLSAMFVLEPSKARRLSKMNESLFAGGVGDHDQLLPLPLAGDQAGVAALALPPGRPHRLPMLLPLLLRRDQLPQPGEPAAQRRNLRRQPHLAHR